MCVGCQFRDDHEVADDPDVLEIDSLIENASYQDIDALVESEQTRTNVSV